MSIIYEQSPNGLYATGQRTVSTFPSGLIRVDQTFACRTSAAATHRATLAVGADFPGDSYPAIDGLKIFPEPQEKRRNDGFVEFTVSGYGRLNTVGTQKTELKVSVFQTKKYKSDKITLLKVRKNSETLTIPDFNSNTEFLAGQINTFAFTNATLAFGNTSTGGITSVSAENLFVAIFGLTQSTISTSGTTKYIGSSQESLLSSYQERNFGEYNEVTMVFENTGINLLNTTSQAITVS